MCYQPTACKTVPIFFGKLPACLGPRNAAGQQPEGKEGLHKASN